MNQAASRTEEAPLHLLINAITDYAIYMLGKDGRISSWNSGAERFKGYEEREIVGKHFSIFYTDEDRRDDLPGRALEAAARDGKFEGEGWRLRKDGSRFWAHVVINPIYDQAGSSCVKGYAKITRDLTEQMGARRALRRSENQFSLLVRNVTDYAIYVLDLDGNVRTWNAGAERIKGYAAHEIVGRHFSRFYTQEDQAKGEPMQALHTAAREGRFATEGWRVRKDGGVFWASVVIDVILDDREIVGFAKVTRDLSDIKKARLDLERARDALFQSQKMEAVGHLTSGVAHDFNGILAGVLGSLEILRKRLLEDPSITPILDNAIQTAGRGASLTQRMMAFARRQELSPEATDLRSLVIGMTAILARSVGPAIAIETRFVDSLGPVRIDPRQFEIAILNLVLNARDAMPDGGRIIIAAREQDVDSNGNQGDLICGRYVRLSVGDDGDGMDEGILSRAPEALFTTKYPDQGSGLGLPTVYDFAERSGGRFVLRSKKGKGTVAELWLPKSSGPALTPAGASVRPTGAGHFPEAVQVVVLAVDHDRLSLMQTSAMLTNLGHRVLFATSGETALEMLRGKERIDVVLIDHSMLGITGAELAEGIRLEWPTLPVIFATPLADPILQQIPKPFHQGDLAAAITQAVVVPPPAAGQIGNLLNGRG
jgi:PAS domain S-box-containing protein